MKQFTSTELIKKGIEVPEFLSANTFVQLGSNFYTELEVTPDLAELILEDISPEYQRPESRYNLAILRRAWEANRFEDVAEPIKFNQIGANVDKKHTLKAQLLEGKTFVHTFAIGLSLTAHKVLDEGKSRTLSHLLYGAYRNPQHLASTLRFIANYKDGNYLQLGRSKKKTRANIEYTYILDENPFLPEMVNTYHSMILKSLDQPISSRIAAGIYYCAVVVEGFPQKDVAEFLARFINNINLEPGTYIHEARGKIMKNKENFEQKYKDHIPVGWLIEALNHYVAKDYTGSLKYTGKARQEFPKLKMSVVTA